MFLEHFMLGHEWFDEIHIFATTGYTHIVVGHLD
jgi:hypothetical protein